MSEVAKFLKEYTAPLEDNYGKVTYDAVVDSMAQMLPALVVAESKHIWRVSWTKDGKRVSTLFGSNNSQEDMEKTCERMAMMTWKRPIVLEAIVEMKVWE